MSSVKFQIVFTLIFALFMAFAPSAYAAQVQRQSSTYEAAKDNLPKLKKAFEKKEKLKKKQVLERFRLKPVNAIGLCLGIGVLLFILGLILKIKALWIIGLCMFGLPVLFGIALLLILIIGFATYGGGLC